MAFWMALAALAVAQIAVGSALRRRQLPVAPLPVLVLEPQRNQLEPPPADLVDGSVLRDPEQPGRELVLRIVPVQHLIHLDEHLLGQVVSVVRIAQQPEQVVDQPALVALDQVAESLPVAFENRRHQVFVGRLHGTPCHGWIRKLHVKVAGVGPGAARRGGARHYLAVWRNARRGTPRGHQLRVAGHQAGGLAVEQRQQVGLDAVRRALDDAADLAALAAHDQRRHVLSPAAATAAAGCCLLSSTPM